MNYRQRTILAIGVFFVFVAATQWAVRGIHQPTGNSGWLGTELAGVEGYGTGLTGSGVVGSSEFGAFGELGSVLGGVHGVNPSVTTEGMLGTSSYGVFGAAECQECYGVHGSAGGQSTRGVFGQADGATASGVIGSSVAGFGVSGYTTNGTGVFGQLNPGGVGHAGYFQGRVHVNGELTKSGGTFMIDHPLDPAGKYLSHSFVESPDRKNIYDGVATLEADGTAVVELPEWFEALNKDFRYQLTCIGENAPIFIAEKIKENRFRIAGGYAGMEVSWQVTGSRNDVYARAYPLAVEELKGPDEAGRFLHPQLYGAAETQRIGFDPRRTTPGAVAQTAIRSRRIRK